jgi:hypothetical protein
MAACLPAAAPLPHPAPSQLDLPVNTAAGATGSHSPTERRPNDQMTKRAGVRLRYYLHGTGGGGERVGMLGHVARRGMHGRHDDDACERMMTMVMPTMMPSTMVYDLA